MISLFIKFIHKHYICILLALAYLVIDSVLGFLHIDSFILTDAELGNFYWNTKTNSSNTNIYINKVDIAFNYILEKIEGVLNAINYIFPIKNYSLMVIKRILYVTIGSYEHLIFLCCLSVFAGRFYKSYLIDTFADINTYKFYLKTINFGLKLLLAFALLQVYFVNDFFLLITFIIFIFFRFLTLGFYLIN